MTQLPLCFGAINQMTMHVMALNVEAWGIHFRDYITLVQGQSKTSGVYCSDQYKTEKIIPRDPTDTKLTGIWLNPLNMKGN